MAQSEPHAGKDSIHQLYRISFTWCKPSFKNWTDDEFSTFHELIKSEFDQKFPKSKYVFQLERAPTTSLLHYQGHINLKVKKRLAEFLKEVQPTLPGIHVSPSSKAGETDAEFYCMKEETRVSGPYADKDFIFPDYSDISAPSGWQLEAQAILTGPPQKRTIYWIWEEVGCTGKSDFTTYMELNHRIIGLGLSTALDNFYAVSENVARGYIFDIPRSLPKRFDWAEVYMSLEKIKDRNFLSTKYKPKKVILPVIPHVMVFSNQPPDLTQLSRDRWRVLKITDNKLVDN